MNISDSASKRSRPSATSTSSTGGKDEEDAELLKALSHCQALISRRMHPREPSSADPDLNLALATTPVPEAWAKTLLKLVFSSAEIQDRVSELANKINAEYAGREIVVVGLLNGAICFLTDLIRQLTVPYVVDFMKLSSYKGTSSKVHFSSFLALK